MLWLCCSSHLRSKHRQEVFFHLNLEPLYPLWSPVSLNPLYTGHLFNSAFVYVNWRVHLPIFPCICFFLFSPQFLYANSAVVLGRVWNATTCELMCNGICPGWPLCQPLRGQQSCGKCLLFNFDLEPHQKNNGVGHLFKWSVGCTKCLITVYILSSNSQHGQHVFNFHHISPALT